MMNICTVCKEEFDDDDSHELSDNDVCPNCYKELYDLSNPIDRLIIDEDFYSKYKADFTFEDLHSDLEED